ncbi:hypothetical protein Tco_1260666, partial [Tanacetum coccineum]
TTLLNAAKEYGEKVKGKDAQASGEGLVTGLEDMSNKRSRVVKRKELVGTDGINSHMLEKAILASEYFERASSSLVLL